MEKVDIFKTVTQARSANFLGEEWAYISSVSGDSDIFLFCDEKCHLLDDENEFYNIINKQFENGKIYIALAFLNERALDNNDECLDVNTSIGDFKIYSKDIVVDLESDYGIIVDKNLDYKYAHRIEAWSGPFLQDLKGYELQLENIIHDCIVFKE